MPEPRTTFQLIADRGDARSRLDRILVRRLTQVSRLSRSLAQRWIESGAVTVDGCPAHRASMRVREGAAIDVRVPPSTPLRQRPEAAPGPLTILFEDEAVIVVDKPAGLVVHPSYRCVSGTLLNALLWHLRDRAHIRPGIVTRLDKDTSGLVLVAMTGAAHAALQRDSPDGRVRKSYLAIVRGWPTRRQGGLDHRLGRDPNDRRRMIVTRDGADSETRYEVLSRWEGPEGREALLRCELVTGRTHQIRVHLSAEGWPIVGDRTYGGGAGMARQALHAWRLSFPHPVTRRLIEVEAALPEDIRTRVPAAHLPSTIAAC
jgi:23S rRNA pseudouridine1911/1915/1917 synthase